MTERIAATCAAKDCTARFEGRGYQIRERMWAHHDTHAYRDYPVNEDGERELFRFDPVVLSESAR